VVSVDVPESLPARLYLLAYDTRRQRLVARSQLGHLLRAAALTDLFLSGRLADQAGKPRVVGSGGVADPVLARVLAQVAESRPRSWDHWITKDTRGIKFAVRDQLAAGQWIRVEPYRVLGLFRASRISLRRPAEVKRLASTVVEVLRPGQPVTRVDPREAAIVALASAAGLSRQC
jgi:Golgi phosphoprotein 3 GPP34